MRRRAAREDDEKTEDLHRTGAAIEQRRHDASPAAPTRREEATQASSNRASSAAVRPAVRDGNTSSEDLSMLGCASSPRNKQLLSMDYALVYIILYYRHTGLIIIVVLCCPLESHPLLLLIV
jgi:hypothetical protein